MKVNKEMQGKASAPQIPTLLNKTSYPGQNSTTLNETRRFFDHTVFNHNPWTNRVNW